MMSFISHRLESRTRPILTPYDGWRRWDSNLRTPACKSPLYHCAMDDDAADFRV